MWISTGDPHRDYDAYERDQERQLSRYPICAECGERIQQEEALYIDGHYYCDDCIEAMKISIGD